MLRITLAFFLLFSFSGNTAHAEVPESTTLYCFFGNSFIGTIEMPGGLCGTGQQYYTSGEALCDRYKLDQATCEKLLPHIRCYSLGNAQACTNASLGE